MHVRKPKAARPSYWQIILPFWRSEQKWMALAMLALVICIGFSLTWLWLQSNRLNGEVVDATVGRNWQLLWPVLLASVAVAVANSAVSYIKVVVLELLKLRWRTWMTHRYLQAWTLRVTYYDVEREQRVDNTDQRIAEDVARFVEMTLDFVVNLIYVVSSTITFTVVLWKLGGALTLELAELKFSIPGYQVWLVYAYSISVVLVTHYFGRQLIGLLNHRQSVEANFRFLGMQLRENAEQIAFYNGGRREAERMEESFEKVRKNKVAIIWRTFKVSLVRDGYMDLFKILPTLASLPRYLAGAISLGDMTRIVGAFDAVKQSLSWFVQAYIGFVEWVAIGNRLCELSAALHAPRGKYDDIRVERRTQTQVAASSLYLRRPEGTALAHLAPLRIEAGERWLLRGRSGSGKSTMLRALAGLWPHGQGEVTLPREATLMFLPQRSYIPAGTLKAALCYPSEPQTFLDTDCQEVLSACRLESYIDALGDEDRWQTRLSGGEQQRLAVARALLHRPEFLFLDEATSALDPATEQALYVALRERLPRTALVSVAHRQQLEAFHEHIFEIGDPVAENIVA